LTEVKNPPTLPFYWKLLASLPDIDNKSNPGVAGSFSGINNHKLIVAGGANFPNEPVWKNGEKKYWDVIYVYDLAENQPGEWMPERYHLPQPAGYGASLTLHDGIICMGGKNRDGFLSAVLFLQWKDDHVQIKFLPDLPVPLASMAAAQIGDDIYIAGGENEDGTHDKFYRLNISQPSRGWEDLGRLPYGAVSDAVLVSQWNGTETALYLVGGKTAADSGNRFSGAVYAFSPNTRKWSKRSDITLNGKPVGLAAGTGCALGNHLIALFGGDDGVLFNQPAVNHPGFNKTIFIYDTSLDQWSQPGCLPFPVQVTTNIVSADGTILIPSGEIRPAFAHPLSGN
jgi:N-acetylneuraminic acid mutarotase